MHRLTIFLILIFAVTACATNAGKTQRLRIGMTKADVIGVLGRPVSMGADKQSELLYYRLIEGGAVLDGNTGTYFVRLVNGKVDSFGRVNEPQAPYEVMRSTPLP